ncbi:MULTISPECIES: MgtC/SapB family protein [Ramlibacter]|uniref:DUF4010 domain-containing protein n=1 Tax=Ramlibacter pinisoli TaxID=2682844 RepID=A0A6N8IPW5_9BURK|nr:MULTISPECIES: DUF4010 domain-containing protein [Ramlibacter]MBA2963963.1 DUF4010 domain-containing protein [Ramlibacter sp. CGMCC 1.13660]MVQ28929.1 DUF4010 domain-containing protein [Ramlibacter pinisoli]
MAFDNSDFIPTAQALAPSLAVGLLLGLERGWRERELAEGGRVAGLRTFGLIGLLGGLLGLDLDPLPFAAGLLAIALLFVVSYGRASRAGGTLSITSAVAAFVTYALGALAASGSPMVAIAAAVVVALLLDLKAVLHRWLRLIEPAELNALLQLGVLSAAVLPALPDVGMGPYAAINPYKTWLAVILIASLSLAGHAATRMVGARQGLLWVGLLGGLASSTAATLSLSRTVHSRPELAAAGAAAILAACGVMFVRMAIVVTVLQPQAALRLGLLLVLLAAVCLLLAWLWWRRAAHDQAAPDGSEKEEDSRVFDLGAAMMFGASLAAIAVIARAARDAFGIAGLYGVAFVSGLVDVDAPMISSLQMAAQGQLAPTGLSITVLLAAVANLVSKATMSWAVGGARLGAAVARGYLFVGAAGAAMLAGMAALG